MARKNINNLSFETMASVIDSVDIGLDSEGDNIALDDVTGKQLNIKEVRKAREEANSVSLWFAISMRTISGIS